LLDLLIACSQAKRKDQDRRGDSPYFFDLVRVSDQAFLGDVPLPGYDQVPLVYYDGYYYFFLSLAGDFRGRQVVGLREIETRKLRLHEPSTVHNTRTDFEVRILTPIAQGWTPAMIDSVYVGSGDPNAWNVDSDIKFITTDPTSMLFSVNLYIKRFLSSRSVDYNRQLNANVIAMMRAVEGVADSEAICANQARPALERSFHRYLLEHRKGYFVHYMVAKGVPIIPLIVESWLARDHSFLQGEPLAPNFKEHVPVRMICTDELQSHVLRSLWMCHVTATGRNTF